MKKRVPLHGKPQGFVDVDPEATNGAVVGVNLRWRDGRVVSEAELLRPAAEPAGVVSVPAPAGVSYTDAMADARVAAGIAAHEAEDNPHPQYLLAAEAARPVLPLVTGEIVGGQPQLMYDPSNGTLIYAEIA
ncbi:hypothetical protein MASR1M8_15760 [Thermomonas brevis]